MLLFMEGGWHEQTKMVLIEGVAKKLAAAGFAAFAIMVAVDASLHNDPGQQPPAFPRQIEEVEEAVAWVEANCGTFNGATSKICLVGGSAGAHLAIYAGMKMNEVSAGRIRAVVGLSGPYALQKLAVESVAGQFNILSLHLAANVSSKEIEEYVAGTLAEPKKATLKTFLEKWSPSFVVSGATNPKFFIAHAEGDGVVPVEQTTALFSLLTSAGCTVTKYTPATGGHGFGLNGTAVGATTIFSLYVAFLQAA